MSGSLTAPKSTTKQVTSSLSQKHLIDCRQGDGTRHVVLTCAWTLYHLEKQTTVACPRNCFKIFKKTWMSPSVFGVLKTQNHSFPKFTSLSIFGVLEPPSNPAVWGRYPMTWMVKTQEFTNWWLRLKCWYGFKWCDSLTSCVETRFSRGFSSNYCIVSELMTHKESWQSSVEVKNNVLLSSVLLNFMLQTSSNS